MPCKGIKPGDCVYFVAEEFESNRFLICGRRINFDDVATHAKPATRKINVVALV